VKRSFPLWVAALAVTTLMQATSAFLLSAMAVLGPTLTEAAGVRAVLVGETLMRSDDIVGTVKALFTF